MFRLTGFVADYQNAYLAACAINGRGGTTVAACNRSHVLALVDRGFSPMQARQILEHARDIIADEDGADE